MRSIITSLGIWCVLAMRLPGDAAPADSTTGGPRPGISNAVLATSAADVYRATQAEQSRACRIRLEGVVCWVHSTQSRMLLQDDTGAFEIDLDFQGRKVQPGDRLLIEGLGMAERSGGCVKVGGVPVVDNNGLHGSTTRSGSIHLTEGFHAIRAIWFNHAGEARLNASYEGPDLPLQRIPGAVLFRSETDPASGVTNFVHGLDYISYEGLWGYLPDFGRVEPASKGRTANFDLSVACRAEYAGLDFHGFLKVAREGLYSFHLQSDDGSRLFVGPSSLHATITGSSTPPVARRMFVGKEGTDAPYWAVAEGDVAYASRLGRGLMLELSSGPDLLRVEVADATGMSEETLLKSHLRLTGIARSTWTASGRHVADWFWSPSWKEIELLEPPTEPRLADRADNSGAGGGAPTLLTSVEQVRSLKTAAAAGHPVKIQGVIISRLASKANFVLHDSKWGIYVIGIDPLQFASMQQGDFCEIEGVTQPGDFAPIIEARRVTRLGLGSWPLPLQPAWDQLMNGTLSCQYVEIQGVVTRLHPGGITLLTRAGRIKVLLDELSQAELARFDNALVRLRGCLFSAWDGLTRQVKNGEIRIKSALFMVDRPAPLEPFAVPLKRASELLLFDPHAGAFQRVRVSGQIVHQRNGLYFLMDGGQGVRFTPKETVSLTPGDKVELAGFLEVGGVSPLLRDAHVRLIGKGPLPEAKTLGPGRLIDGRYDATLVKIQSLLVNRSTNINDLLLEMQSNGDAYTARLQAGQGWPRSLPVGSLLELTGVYAGKGGDWASGQDIDYFELLINSPGDISILKQPSWLTPRRMLIAVGALTGVLLVALIWIQLLRRQVGKRTRQLEQQIRTRQSVEQQRVVEQERVRLARDLHDDLGGGLTEISMLGSLATNEAIPLEKRAGYLDQLTAKARQLVAALDEIVWAVNPRYDTLASLAGYCSLYAQRLLGLAALDCRLEVDSSLPEFPLESRQRHSLFLAFKEALNNVIKHSGATWVLLRILVENGELNLALTDNGRGLKTAGEYREGDGLANMKARLAALGGQCEILSDPGQGATVRFRLPLHQGCS